MIAIRPYREADEAALLPLVRELQAAEVVIFDRMKPVEEMGHWYIDYLKKCCAEEDGTILVATEAGAIVGYATILTRVIEDGSGDEVPYVHAHVGDLVVTEAARGRGIARLLLDECERRARSAGRDELRISVLAQNRHAHEIYRATGFDDLLVTMRKKLDS